MATVQDGRVLIAGGMVENGAFLSSAELFDPATCRFSTTDNMRSRRVGHSATLLLTGTELVAGTVAGWVFEGVSGWFVVAGSVGTTTGGVYR
jgi:hypothetical protein